ncbi:hypothetical protein DY000_02030214 [Brassica cretica]|uniref:Uncharacterized protein n=1 Tax=Brassica cretica TaxID=69181 RepID=A0ABQ7DWL9_BRACR|nr:hypothetical protein DY000_02030214 [Brassica cretica]
MVFTRPLVFSLKLFNFRSGRSASDQWRLMSVREVAPSHPFSCSLIGSCAQSTGFRGQGGTNSSSLCSGFVRGAKDVCDGEAAAELGGGWFESRLLQLKPALRGRGTPPGKALTMKISRGWIYGRFRTRRSV